MALIFCPECNEPVSDLAFSCPHCGCPIRRPRPLPTDSVSLVGSFLHVAGLNLQKGTFCRLSYSADVISIKAPFSSFHLSGDNVLDASITSYRELLTHYSNLTKENNTSQSVKDTLCQAIEISSKKKFIRPHTNFLIITYIGEDKAIHAIIFQLNDGNFRAAQRIVARYAEPVEQIKHHDIFL